MDISTILWTTFISLVGLQFCLPDGDGEKMADQTPMFWCPNPFFRIIYGLFQLVGVIFVIGFALYLTFTEHWWYILIYLAGVLLAKFAALLMQIPIALIFSKQIERAMYGGLIAKRICGTLMIALGIVLCLTNQ
ncbi:MAG: hypothetical protein NC111_05895 [Bacteroides sp.]|nr:hypothetical protein [Bacteroides sp.]MCM1412721.1 hypothetical protein [Bacteroides sp.]MCM1472040.1 hypothetical protein [Bacteroides sp.]